MPRPPVPPRSIVGYCAHWRESLVDPDTKIIRPQQDYRGVWLRHFEAIDRRSAAVDGDTLVKLPPSHAYERRVAGTSWQ